MKNKDMQKIADAVNLLGDFLGRRDLPALTQESVKQAIGSSQADVFVLFGGSIPAGGDVLAEAIRGEVAKSYVIVGGAGHTTQTLRDTMHSLCPEVETEDLPEAIIFQNYIRSRYGLSADYLETSSTNCGNNITFLLELLRENHIAAKSMILCQDATMQLRMGATLKKYAPDMTILHYASYRARILAGTDNLSFAEDIFGMWNTERYILLLMGEIPRLTDDENGYGPRGTGYIVHVDIPKKVEDSYRCLLENGYDTREANPLYKCTE